jgi:hypothetical protein
MTALYLAVGAILGFFAFPFLQGFFKAVGERIDGRKAIPPPVATTSPQVHPCAVSHQFIAIDAQSVTVSELPHTAVLMRCEKCEARITATFLGTWTIEVFLQKESVAAREVRALEALTK